MLRPSIHGIIGTDRRAAEKKIHHLYLSRLSFFLKKADGHALRSDRMLPDMWMGVHHWQESQWVVQ
jgi:hypothetical protein